MKKITAYSLLIIAHLVIVVHTAHAQVTTMDSLKNLRRERRALVPDASLKIYDVKTPEIISIDSLFTISEHPAFSTAPNESEMHNILAEINLRNRNLNKDTLLTSDIFYIFKPYFDWLRNEDPHLRIEITPGFDSKTYKSQTDFDNAPGYKQLPFTLLVINDSVIIHKSVDTNFKTGDLLLSLNEVPISEYLKYSYRDRYMSPTTLMNNYYYSFAVNKFNVRLKRGEQIIDVNTSGLSFKEKFDNLSKPEDYNVKVYEQANTGYIQIKKFYPCNDRLIKIVHSAIKDFKKKGCTNVIIDLRVNPGGSGHSFDKLLSIFINKPTVQYMKGQRLMVSKKTLADFDFLTPEMEGQLVDVPEQYIVKEFNTVPKMYVDGMNYYLLISSNTGSVAATFANIIQYNGAAKLVGEPLLRNALKFGEVVFGYDIPPYLLYIPAISTMEFDEYTNAVDGVVMPDISIPYIAKDYMTGRDAMLEELINIIKKQQ